MVLLLHHRLTSVYKQSVTKSQKQIVQPSTDGPRGTAADRIVAVVVVAVVVVEGFFVVVVVVVVVVCGV